MGRRLERDLPEFVVLRLSPCGGKAGRHRALLRGSATENPAHGVLCKRGKCGSHHLFHFPEIQPGMKKPQLLYICTSSLTSPLSQAVDNLPCLTYTKGQFRKGVLANV